jgi:hypothetical protein
VDQRRPSLEIPTSALRYTTRGLRDLISVQSPPRRRPNPPRCCSVPLGSSSRVLGGSVVVSATSIAGPPLRSGRACPQDIWRDNLECDASLRTVYSARQVYRRP